MTQAQPWLVCWVPALVPELAAGSLLDAAPLLEVDSALELVLAPGLTETLMGVGWVLKTGI